MELPSSDGIEILSTTRTIAARPPTDPTTSALTSRTWTVTPTGATLTVQGGSTPRLENVITLSDDSDDAVRIAPQAPPTQRQPLNTDDDDDDVVIVRETQRIIQSSSDDDLEPLEKVSRVDPGIRPVERNATGVGVASTSKNPLSPSSPVLSDYGRVREGRLESGGSYPFHELEHRRQTAPEVDPWAAILGSDEGESERARKSKGKGKAGETRVRRKRSLKENDHAGEDISAGRGAVKRRSPLDQESRSTAGHKLPQQEKGAAEKMTKTALKKQETADRIKLRQANSLKTADKAATAAELTIHISGTAFKSHDETESDTGDETRGRERRKGKKPRRKVSPWLEITERLEERMAKHNCAVERPELPRRDLGCEGAIRWTRVCTTKWDDQRGMFLPLPENQSIVVEEDTRLIFLSAHDLSQQVACRTLSSFMTTVQAQIPPHVNLFVLLYGLQAIYRDLERVRQAEYKRELRRKAGEADGPIIKPAGIGTEQPSKDELELAMIRMQVESRCMIVNVEKVEEAIDWLEQISFDVSQKPYQRHKQSHIDVLGTGEANLPSGKDLQDTYIKMLASLKGVTDGIAKGIAGCYPTLRSLLEAWEYCEGGEKGRKEMLIGIGKGRNIDGTATHRAIGATLSANIYRMMTSSDPEMFV